jgi:hypothetical protein
MYVPTDKNLGLVVFGTVCGQPGADFFQIQIPNGEFIGAKDSEGKASVPVKTPSEENLAEMVSDPKRILRPETQPVLFNCPNPFGGPGKEATAITYHLKTGQEVTLDLFTLTGELVWNLFLPFGDPRTQAGTHVVEWNGRNGKGAKVLNGVYLLFMKTADGKVEKTKIAVVK